jgi:hypothetical protein
MSSLGARMPIELFTDTLYITGEISTRNIHIRDELNDTRRSLLVFSEMEAATLGDMRAPRISSDDACIKKDEILLAIPRKVKGSTSALTQRSIQARLGKNEHRLLLDIPPFRVKGNFYFVGTFRVEDTWWRDTAPFVALTNAQISYLPNPGISFAVDEVAVSAQKVRLLCAEFKEE